MTRRDLSNLIDAMVSRKQGYKEEEKEVKIEQSDEVEQKVKRSLEKRFGKK